MQYPKIKVEPDDIEYAIGPTPWDLGNQILYDLCSSHPKHQNDEEIIAKVWLIGRAYAAAIERRRNKSDESDEFYERVITQKIKESNIDELLDSLPKSSLEELDTIPITLKTHKNVMEIFKDLTSLEKRSLTSKYLHFHRPDLFFIYDNRAQKAITQLTPDFRYIHRIKLLPEEVDEYYYKFFFRAYSLYKKIIEDFKIYMTPRQIDKVLLNVYKKIKSSEQRNAL